MLDTNSETVEETFEVKSLHDSLLIEDEQEALIIPTGGNNLSVMTL